MPFVQRDEEGNVNGSFANAQPGFAEEWVEDDSPELVRPPTREQVDSARLRAYANPVTGSDRYLAEASVARLSGDEAAATALEEKMIARRAEIQAENPWPEIKKLKTVKK